MTLGHIKQRQVYKKERKIKTQTLRFQENMESILVIYYVESQKENLTFYATWTVFSFFIYHFRSSRFLSLMGIFRIWNATLLSQERLAKLYQSFFLFVYHSPSPSVSLSLSLYSSIYVSYFIH